MEKYYVCGCIEIEGTVGRVEDEDAEFWSLYKRDDSGLSQAIADFTDLRSAESVMTAYCDHAAEVARLNEQVRALVAASLQEINDDMALAFHRATADGAIGGDDIEEIKNGLRAAIANLFANTPTDAILREVGAQEVDEFAKKISSPYAERSGETYEDGFNSAIEVMQKKARDYAASIRAGEVQP